MSSDLETMLAKLVPVVRPIVEAIEASIPTTKDHYDQYMVALTKLVGMTGRDERAMYLAIGVALQRAGANKNGVQSALRVMGYL